VNHQEFSWSTRPILTKKGQSTIEVLVCLSIVLSLILMITRFGLNVTSGFMVHYANYMASRTFLVFDQPSAQSPDATDAVAAFEAKRVFDSYGVDAFLMAGSRLTSILTAVYPDDSNPRKVLTGTYIEFQQKFSGSKMFGGNRPVEFISESYLGREPTRYDCASQICKVMQQTVTGGLDCGPTSTAGTKGVNITEFDDGC